MGTPNPGIHFSDAAAFPQPARVCIGCNHLSQKHPLALDFIREYEQQRSRGVLPRTRSAVTAAGKQVALAATMRMPEVTVDAVFMQDSRAADPDGLTVGPFSKDLDGNIVERTRRFPMDSRTVHALSSDLAHAACFWLTDEVEQSIRSMPLPTHTVAPITLPYPSVFLTGESIHPVPGTRTWADGLLLQVGDTRGDGTGVAGLQLFHVGAARDSVAVVPTTIPFGAAYPADFGSDPLFVESFVLKVLAFLASPYSETTQDRAPRPQRRSLQKAGYEEPVVHVVRLRASARKAVADEARDRSGPRHRFWVRGHFRAQWYPSLQAHKVVWIAPFLKGPESTEVKQAVYAVVR